MSLKFLLIAISVLICGFVFYQLKYDFLYNDEPSAAALNSELQDSDLDQLESLDADREVLQPPLFVTDVGERIDQSQILNAAVNVHELEKLIISGVVKGGTVAYAYIANIDDEERVRRVEIGFNYKGWRISEITEKSVKFYSDGLKYELFISSSESTGNAIISQANKLDVVGNVKNKSIPRSNQLGNQVMLNEKQIRELKAQKGYSFDLDEVFDDS